MGGGKGKGSAGRAQMGMSEGSGAGDAGGLVGYFVGTASDRRLPIHTGRLIIKPQCEFLALKL